MVEKIFHLFHFFFFLDYKAGRKSISISVFHEYIFICAFIRPEYHKLLKDFHLHEVSKKNQLLFIIISYIMVMNGYEYRLCMYVFVWRVCVYVCMNILKTLTFCYRKETFIIVCGFPFSSSTIIILRRKKRRRIVTFGINIEDIFISLVLKKKKFYLLQLFSKIKA